MTKQSGVNIEHLLASANEQDFCAKARAAQQPVQPNVAPTGLWLKHEYRREAFFGDLINLQDT